MPPIFVVRHGETEGNQRRIFRGLWDVPLNAAGRRQAERAGDALREIEFRRIYTSPLGRARETAAAIASRQRDAEVIQESALVDIDYGDWSQVADSEVEQRYPDLHRLWRDAPERVVFPQGEGLADVRSRVASFLGRLGTRPAAEPVLLVSHRVPIKVMLCVALGLEDSAFWRISVDTASVSALRIDAQGQGLICANDTSHLQPLAERFGGADF